MSITANFSTGTAQKLSARAAVLRLDFHARQIRAEAEGLKLDQFYPEQLAGFATFCAQQRDYWEALRAKVVPAEATPAVASPELLPVAAAPSLTPAQVWHAIRRHTCACGAPKAAWSCFCRGCTLRLPLPLIEEIAQVDGLSEVNPDADICNDTPRRYLAALAHPKRQPAAL